MSDKVTSSSIAYNFVHGHTEAYTDKQGIKELDARITELNVSFANWLLEKYYPSSNDKSESMWVHQDEALHGLPLIESDYHTTKQLFDKFQKQQ